MNDNDAISIPIKQLAAYCLDYARLIHGNSNLGQKLKTPSIGNSLLTLDKILFDEESDEKFILKLRVKQKAIDENLNDDEKKIIDEENEKIKKEIEISNKVDDISLKLKTQSYTKQLVIQTGFVDFSAKKLKTGFFGQQVDNSQMVEEKNFPLLQIPININVKHKSDYNEITCELASSAITILVEQLNKYLPVKEYDEIFKYIANIESQYKNIIPITKDFIDNLWSQIEFYLNKQGAKNVSEKPDLSWSIMSLTNKANYFLLEDLELLTKLDDNELNETSLSAWSSDENMNIEERVEDDGSTEIFFPFPYDKWQLKALGILKNKATIIEGPPGTGKSQTIANLLVHLAATGNKVLFASQKDQAVRGVKDKLKSLEIKFLFGYIPDRSSRLYNKTDEKDSASNTLISMNQEFRKMSLLPDQKIPLQIIDNDRKCFVKSIIDQRKFSDIVKKLKELDYIKIFANSSVSEKIMDQYNTVTQELADGIKELKQYKSILGDFIECQDNKYKDINFNNREKDIKLQIEDLLLHIKEILPDGRINWLRSMALNGKIRVLLNSFAKEVFQEIFDDVKLIVLDEKTTKSRKITLLTKLANYFNYKIIKSNIEHNIRRKREILKDNNLSEELVIRLNEVINNSSEAVFDDIRSYRKLKQDINNLSSTLNITTNQVRWDIKDLRKYYIKDVSRYVQNRIMQRVDVLKSQKQTKAKLERIARSLTKSKKAYKTFDRLKHSAGNFSTMSEVLPIWMMSLDDVSRIMPAEANCFDYVIIDEASQCNMAYALPAMLRAKHTIFFGDSLQMRDTNTLFKSNEQLSAIAKKHKIGEDYQIKADEDTVKSVMDIATLSGFKTIVLRNHYRSPRQLIGFSNDNFYEKVGKRLEVINDTILKYKDTDRVLINHVIKPNPDIEISEKTNYSEVSYIKQLVQTIREDEKLKDKSIAVLTFFNEQAELLQRELELFSNVKVSTIEGIQGDERDIVIYSFVITDPMSGKKRYTALTGEGGEIRKSANEGRVNVAFSRAREQVHCVTSIPVDLWPDKIWIKRYLQYVEQNGSVAYQHKFNEQNFDSNFEANIYKYLSSVLSPKRYLIQTQVESCGFKIDQVITDLNNNRKLAIECDGPTHFENGDGQVYVADDYERQGMLESAGWTFYRVSYFDYIENTEKTCTQFLNYITKYFDGNGNMSNEHVSMIVKKLESMEIMPEPKKLPQYKSNIKP